MKILNNTIIISRNRWDDIYAASKEKDPRPNLDAMVSRGLDFLIIEETPGIWNVWETNRKLITNPNHLNAVSMHMFTNSQGLMNFSLKDLNDLKNKYGIDV